MHLHVTDTQGLVNIPFGNWLTNLISNKICSELNNYNFVHWDKFLTEDPSLTRLYKNQSYKTEDVIVFASKQLVCTGYDTDITIKFKPNVLTQGFDRVPLKPLLKTINFGNLNTKGCPIFTETFQYFADNIDTYIGLYYNL